MDGRMMARKIEIDFEDEKSSVAFLVSDEKRS